MKKEIKVHNTPDTELEYLLTGKENDETLLFVHGLGSNLRQFFPQQNYFSEEYKVLSVSLRGHGKSSLPRRCDTKDFTVKSYTDDLEHLLRDKGVDKFHYIGNSMGGMVGFELLKRIPRSFKSLITFGTTAEMNMSSISQKFVTLITKIIFKLYGKESYGEHIARNSTTYPTAQRMVSYLYSFTDLETIVHTQNNIASYSYISTLQDTDVPVMMLKCDRDKEINKNLDSTLRVFDKKDNFRVKELERVGHFANLERPEEFNEVLEGFIRECSG